MELQKQLLFTVIFTTYFIFIAGDDFYVTLGHLKVQTSDRVQTEAANGVVRRLISDKASLFQLTVDPNLGPVGKDTFKIVKEEGAEIVTIVGTSGVAATWGFHHYLKYYCHCHVSWDSDQLTLPEVLPTVNLTVTSADRMCARRATALYGGTGCAEREIDWMALNGINLALAFTGQEAIWQRVYLRLNLTQDDISEHLSGPAFLAWMRMGNMRGFGGPLPDSWHRQSLVLQHFILDRMRELGIVPVLPAFAGHVPRAFKRPYLLEPTDPLFRTVGSMFLSELIAEFGTDHIYNCDTFNEMVPQTANLTYLAQVSNAIFSAMTAVDTTAVWMLQGWLFVNSMAFWGEAQTEAFLTSVPLCAVSSTQKFLVQQHITTSKHQANKQLNSKQRQLFLTQPTTSNVRSEFNISRSLISADIPLYKLKNKVFREFLEKYTQHTIPDESTLRKTYAPSIYDETIQKIRDEIKDSSIWVSIDETPDKEGNLLGRMLILDLQSELNPQYKRLHSYYGQPFIWCMLHNFGGTLGLYGAVENVNQRVFEGRNLENGTMVGTGLTPEGINQNYVMYDLMTEMGWRTQPANLTEWSLAKESWPVANLNPATDDFRGRGGPIAWPPRSPDLNPLDFYLWGHLKSMIYSSPVPDLESLRNRIVACSEDIHNTPGVWDRVRRFSLYAERRYGGVNIHADKAWQLLKSGVYNCTQDDYDMHGADIICLRPSLGSTEFVWYNTTELAMAWDELLDSSEQFHEAANYQHDLVDLTRQILQVKGGELYGTLVTAFREGNITVFQENAQLLRTLLADLDLVLSSNKDFLLGRWLEAAKALGTTDLEKQLYEYNARNQITLWGPHGEILDYATKQWGGVVSHYYLPRWNLFLDALNSSLVEGVPFNQTFTAERIFNEVEVPFTLDTSLFPTLPQGDSVEIAKLVHLRWRRMLAQPTGQRIPYRRSRLSSLTVSSGQYRIFSFFAEQF
ncbi:hypothetical protein ANN_23025 [Periplaneta americana]|uniref:Alpha-N-acetylglucosaminidase n=1 Tax=Periplaneta americana TaxID=6978 RepID=A0ABQ8SKB9_PERAM|nr:hypothetical protein ANN_23025 [Periplaneta americana]